MKNNDKLGEALAVLGILTGLLAYYILAARYIPVIVSKSVDGRLDEVASAKMTCHYRFMRDRSKDIYDMDLRFWVRNNATPTSISSGVGFRCVR